MALERPAITDVIAPFTCYTVLVKCEVCPGWHVKEEEHDA